MDLRKIWAEAQALDVNNVGAWPRWAYGAATTLLALLILGGGTYLFLKPKYEELQREKLTEQDLRLDFERKQKKVASLDAYRAQLKEMERTFGDMLKQLPSKTEVPNLLNDISQTRVASALEEELFQPQPEVTKDFYAVIPNRIIVTGEYHDIGTFVSGVAALPRIVTIDDIDLRPKGGTGRKGKSGLRMNAVAKTYRYLDPAEQAAVTDDKP